MLQKLIRLVSAALLGVVAYFVAVLFGCMPIFFVMPCVLVFVHMILWDLLKCKALDNGFFRFLKFVIFVGTFVILLLTVLNQSLAMMNEDLFSMESTATDMQRQTVGGALAMLSFTFVLCWGCVQSFPSRWVGLPVPVVGIAVGILYGFIPSLLAFFSIGFGKVLACAILLLPIIVLFAYIKENGLLYKDLGYEDDFAGLGLSKGHSSASGGKLVSHATPGGGSGKKPDWREWQYIAQRYSHQVSISCGALYVDVQYSHGDSYVEFYIDGQYELSGATEQYQVDNASNEISSIISDVQQSVFDEASSASNGYVNVSVRVRNIRAR